MYMLWIFFINTIIHNCPAVIYIIWILYFFSLLHKKHTFKCIYKLEQLFTKKFLNIPLWSIDPCFSGKVVNIMFFYIMY